MAELEKIFDSISDLPANVRSRLNPSEQRVFRRVFNQTFRRTNGSTRVKEGAAFRAANGIVRNMGKRASFEARVEIEKIDDEKRIVWGWAYVCEDGGEGVVDHSGDVAEAAEVEKAAHSFNLDSRHGTVMHDEDGGQIVDSIFFSKAVQTALGIDLGKIGWFIGYRVDDDAAWAGVKSGKFKAFSIGGTADTEDLDDGGA